MVALIGLEEAPNSLESLKLIWVERCMVYSFPHIRKYIYTNPTIFL